MCVWGGGCALQGAVWPSAITMATNPLKNIPASLLCDSLLLLVLLIKVDYEVPPQYFFQTPVPQFYAGMARDQSESDR